MDWEPLSCWKISSLFHFLARASDCWRLSTLNCLFFKGICSICSHYTEISLYVYWSWFLSLWLLFIVLKFYKWINGLSFATCLSVCWQKPYLLSYLGSLLFMWIVLPLNCVGFWKFLISLCACFFCSSKICLLLLTFKNKTTIFELSVVVNMWHLSNKNFCGALVLDPFKSISAFIKIARLFCVFVGDCSFCWYLVVVSDWLLGFLLQSN